LRGLLARARDLFWRLLRNREALTVALFSAGNAAAGLVANRVLTQLVPPRPLGELYLLLNLALWFTLPSAAAFLYVQRHWSVARARGVPRAFSRGVATGLALQAALAAAAVLAARALHLAEVTAAGAVALLLASCAQAVQQIAAQVQGLERRRITAGLLELLGQPARLAFLGLAALGLWGGAPTGEGLLWLHAGWMAGLAALILWLALRLLQQVAPQPDQGTPGPELSWRSALGFSLPFLGTALVMQVCTSAERWGLARIDDPASTALFVQAVGLSMAGAGASTSFLGTYFFPLIQQGAAQGEDPLAGARAPLRRYLLLSAAASVALVLLGVTVSGPASTLLFGPRYAAVAGLLPWTVAGAALFTFAQALTIRFVVLRDSVSPNVARIISLVLYAAVLVLLRPREQPALAFARVYCTAQGLYLALMALATLRTAGRPAGPGVL
jgi:O-antigen/teichoic acid export membrane protein